MLQEHPNTAWQPMWNRIQKDRPQKEALLCQRERQGKAKQGKKRQGKARRKGVRILAFWLFLALLFGIDFINYFQKT